MGVARFSHESPQTGRLAPSLAPLWPMTSPMLAFPWDGSPAADAALSVVTSLLTASPSLAVRIARAWEPTPLPMDSSMGGVVPMGDPMLDLQLRAETEAALTHLVETLRATGPHADVTGHFLAFGHAPQDLLAWLGPLVPDLIVLGTQGRGWVKSLLMGAIERRIVADSHRPVLLVRAGMRLTDWTAPKVTGRRAVVAWDGEEPSDAALRALCRLSPLLAVSHVTLLAYVPPPPWGASESETVPEPVALDRFEQYRRIVEEQYPALTVTTERIQGPTLDGAVLDAVTRLQADLLVEGTRAETGWRHVVSGAGLLDNVIGHTPVPILVLHPDPEAAWERQLG